MLTDTAAAGDLVQHYGYMPFGNERYENNTQAFSVTNRYTGQQLDEETGLVICLLIKAVMPKQSCENLSQKTSQRDGLDNQ